LSPPNVGGVADPRDRPDGRVDLQLVRVAFFFRVAARVGGLDDERLDRVEQVVDLGERASVVGDHAAGAFAVLDRLLDAVDVGADAFRDDQARGVVAAPVDAQTVLSRSRRTVSSSLARLRFCWASIEGTFVLIRAMSILPDCFVPGHAVVERSIVPCRPRGE
jgi:hypothetical protein